jgi:hypothetical protein
VDGFLLHQNSTNRERLDVRLFFRLSHDFAKERRFNRPRYGPEACERMVWRSYLEQHAFIFQDGDVGAILMSMNVRRLV